MIPPNWRPLVIALVTLLAGSGGHAQSLSAGSLGTPEGSVGPGPVTVIDYSFPANAGGAVTSVTFLWSAAPCPGAVKIKFFIGGQFFYQAGANLKDERGPFDIGQGLQTVALVPPVVVHAGELIAITSLTTCGEPLRSSGKSVVLAGDASVFACDIRFGTCPPFTSFRPLVVATDDAVSLLKNRFRITLSAIDPRTGRSAIGRGVTQGDAHGFFSLPDFTGDPDFPEVVVKMVDATLSPPPYGGSFWLFYSPLTDVTYTLTVTDQLTGRVRTYASSPSVPGQLCGGVDTNAFPP